MRRVHRSRRLARWLGGASGWLIASACSDDTAIPPTATDATTTTTTSSGTTYLLPGSSTELGTVTTVADATGNPFLPEPDLRPPECDLFAQDCPRGQKCTWVTDGGEATKCVPVVDDPVGTDETCHVEGSAGSGVDDCDLGALCLNVDPETLEGTCMLFCMGDASDVYCEDRDRFCAVSAGGIALCLAKCAPIEQDCPDGQSCIPHQDDNWACVIDASGDMGAYGDPCEFLNVCDPGLICLSGQAVPPGLPCEGAAGCCTEVCDLSDPLGDLQCAGAAEGQTCQAWYAEGRAPAGYENVGACALPA